MWFPKRVYTILRLIRPASCLMVGSVSLFIMITLQRSVPNLSLLIFVFLSIGFIAAGGFAFNDYCDKDTDTITNPHKPLPSNEIKPMSALTLSLLFFGGGLGLAFTINIKAFVILLLDTIILILYSTYIKKKSGLFSNLTVGFLNSTTFIFGEVALFNQISMRSIAFTFIAFGSVAGNILKDIISLEGDRSVGYPTLPLSYGVHSSMKISAFFFILAVLVSPFPYFAGVVNTAYLFPITAMDGILLYAVILLLRKPYKQTAKRQLTITTGGMILVPVALIMGIMLP